MNKRNTSRTWILSFRGEPRYLKSLAAVELFLAALSPMARTEVALVRVVDKPIAMVLSAVARGEVL